MLPSFKQQQNEMKTGSFKLLKNNIEVILIALFSIFLHLIFTTNLEYHRDELLYFSLGLHPAAGYATVPPMIGWIAFVMQNIFGYSLFAVRLFPAIISGIMVLVVADLAKELGGKKYAMILAGTGMVISLFGLRTFSLFQPVHLDLLFWTLTFYLIIKYLNSENDKFLIIIGIVAGLSLLTKYLIGLLFIIILLIIPFTKYRTLFRKKMFWYGILAGLVVFLPNLIWQIVNGLPVINHFSDLSRSQLVNVDRLAFLMEQVILPGAASFLTIAGLLYIFISKRQKNFRFLGVVVIAVIVTLMLMKGKSYYTQGVFPLLIAAGAVSWERLLKKLWTKILLVVILILLTLPIMPIGIPLYRTDKLVRYFKDLEDKYGMTFGRRFEDGTIHSLPQDYADMLGWEELTLITSKAWQMIPDKKAAIIYGENYGQVGAITIIGKKYELPEAISFHESFMYWLPEQFNPDIKSVIYINDELPDEDVNELFAKITRVGSITNPDAREFGTMVYLCEDPVRSFNDFWTERITELKQGD